MWHRVAPRLAERFIVVATDLRGFGDSGKPPSAPDHAPYSMRAIARDQVEVTRASTPPPLGRSPEPRSSGTTLTFLVEGSRRSPEQRSRLSQTLANPAAPRRPVRASIGI